MEARRRQERTRGVRLRAPPAGAGRHLQASPPPPPSSSGPPPLQASGYLNFCDLCSWGSSQFSINLARDWLRLSFPEMRFPTAPSPSGRQHHPPVPPVLPSLPPDPALEQGTCLGQEARTPSNTGTPGAYRRAAHPSHPTWKRPSGSRPREKTMSPPTRCFVSAVSQNSEDRAGCPQANSRPGPSLRSGLEH
nr:serine/arginine repetitive matrix protein 1-like [Equus asinus]